MASTSALVLTACLAAMAGLGSAVEAESDNFLKAGVSIHTHHMALQSEMRRMMSSGVEEDDVDFHGLSRKGADVSRRGQLQQSGPSAGTASLDDYIKDAEDGLSAALGPRWNAKKIEDDANFKTSSLLRGISGPRAMGAIHRMMGALGR